MKARTLLSVLCLVVSVVGFSQKIKLKKGDILVDEVVWLKYDGCGTFQSTCSILNLKGEEVIFIQSYQLEGEAPISPSNSKGILYYMEVKFLGLNASVEFEDYTQKKVLEMIYKGKLINDAGELDEDMVQRFVEKYGSPVSARLNRAKVNTNTVIIREETPRSGVNINIGRK
ncbi:MAG TPA: hypothetical protein VGB44_09960 [Flavobacterium sp.]|jgi:hypothetical protein